jgi:hypothetical protein
MIPCKELMHALVESHANDGVGDFKLNQSHLGFNLVPQGLLMSEHSDKVFDGICYDWMHIYAVSGIFHRELRMLLGKLHRTTETGKPTWSCVELHSSCISPRIDTLRTYCPFTAIRI